MKIHNFALLILFSMLAACADDRDHMNIGTFTSSDAQQALEAASSLKTDREEVLFVCGESSGLAIHGFEWDKGLQEDGIKGGFVIFTETENYDADIIWGGDYNGVVRTTEDGGIVQRTRSGEGFSHNTWNVAYPKSGITESHGVIISPDGDYILFSATMKPGSSSARLFSARCIKWL